MGGSPLRKSGDCGGGRRLDRQARAAARGIWQAQAQHLRSLHDGVVAPHRVAVLPDERSGLRMSHGIVPIRSNQNQKGNLQTY